LCSECCNDPVGGMGRRSQALKASCASTKASTHCARCLVCSWYRNRPCQQPDLGAALPAALCMLACLCVDIPRLSQASLRLPAQPVQPTGWSTARSPCEAGPQPPSVTFFSICRPWPAQRRLPPLGRRWIFAVLQLYLEYGTCSSLANPIGYRTKHCRLAALRVLYCRDVTTPKSPHLSMWQSFMRGLLVVQRAQCIAPGTK
jgi:hypothetical protein